MCVFSMPQLHLSMAAPGSGAEATAWGVCERKGVGGTDVFSCKNLRYSHFV